MNNNTSRLILSLLLLGGCSSEEIVLDFSQDRVGSYGDVRFLKSNINTIVPEMPTGALTAWQYNHPTADRLGRLDASSWQTSLQGTLRASDPADCFTAIENLSYAPVAENEVACFSPEISYADHPDTGDDGVIAAGQSGIWWDAANTITGRGEACGSALMNEQARPHASLQRLSIALTAAGTCVARIYQTNLPDLGGSLDLTSFAQAAGNDLAITVEDFTIADHSSADQAAFITTIRAQYSGDTIASTQKFYLADEFKTAYSGNIETVISRPELASMVLRAEFSVDGSSTTRRSFSALLPPQEVTSFQNFASIAELGQFYHQDFGASYFQAEYRDNAAWQTLVWPTASGNFVANAGRGADSREIQFYLGYNFADYLAESFTQSTGMACFPKIGADYPLYPAVQQQSLVLNSGTGKYEAAATATVFVPTETCDIAFVKGFAGSKGGLTKIVNGPLTNNLLPLTDYQNHWRTLSETN